MERHVGGILSGKKEWPWWSLTSSSSVEKWWDWKTNNLHFSDWGRFGQTFLGAKCSTLEEVHFLKLQGIFAMTDFAAEQWVDIGRELFLHQIYKGCSYWGWRQLIHQLIKWISPLFKFWVFIYLKWCLNGLQAVPFCNRIASYSQLELWAGTCHGRYLTGTLPRLDFHV